MVNKIKDEEALYQNMKNHSRKHKSNSNLLSDNLTWKIFKNSHLAARLCREVRGVYEVVVHVFREVLQ